MFIELNNNSFYGVALGGDIVAKVQHHLQKAAMKSSSSLTRPPLAYGGI